MAINLTPKKQNAVLVGIQLPKVTPAELEGSLKELARLVTTLGYNVVGQITQKRSSEKFSTVLGEGKLRELARWTGGSGEIAVSFERKKNKAALKREEETAESAETTDPGDTGAPAFDLDDGAGGNATDTDAFDAEDSSLELRGPKDQAQIVVVDSELSPSQLRNLESAAGVTVLDRTGVIIEIFSRHANTRAAKLQVEIAKLTYVAPRLRETGDRGDRQGGGIGGKGSGESSLELDKRRIRDRIKELRNELQSVGNEHDVRRARRKQELTVALVGYTNAGKSSLMRAMTGSEVLVADKLFATLDTTIRPLHPETRPRVLMSDTVGFIKKLPHDLVASFKSTLDEALNASLLLFVVDSADAAFRSQLEVTQKVLAEVGVTDDVPHLLVLNKKDCLTDEQLNALKAEFKDGVFISTRSNEDLKFLRDKVMTFFEADMIDDELFVPYTAKGIIGEVRSLMRILNEDYTENGVKLRVRTTPEHLALIQKKLK